MRQFQHRSVAATVAGLALLTLGCRTSMAPELDASLAAGTYALEAVKGRGPVSGSFVLTGDGQATRRVQYSVAGVTGPQYVAVGTFALFPDDTIVFDLREDSGRAASVWHVRGTRAGVRLRIRYPDSLDGPDVVETYRRL
jgi:hypothetical protein